MPRSALRPTLLVLALAAGANLFVSLITAASLPARLPLRVALVAIAWLGLTALLAYIFLPGFDWPWRVLRRALGGVALTIDDGPHPESTPALLDALAACRVHATFFLVGAAIERWPALVRRIVDEGHAIANHTHRHRILLLRTVQQLGDEIDLCQRALAPYGQVHYFRPPHGFKPIGLHRLLRLRGLRLVAWQGTIRDTDAPGAEAITARALALAAPGRILLLHDNPACQGQTAAALPAIVAGYRARGLAFVSLAARVAPRRVASSTKPRLTNTT